jgi:exosortase A
MASREPKPAEGASRAFLLPGALWGVVGLLYVALFYSVFRHMAGQWYDDPNYSHGFLVPVVSAYLVWEMRDKLRGQPREPSFLGAALLVGGLALFLLGKLGAELLLQNVSTVVVLAGLVWLAVGTTYVRRVAFPLAFLLFYVPLPALILNQVAFPLQLFSARCAVGVLRLFDVPVLREGNIIHLAGTTLEVAEACSGIRSLQALVALSTVFAYLAQKTLYKRLALIVLSVPIAIAVNAFRVSGTGLLAQRYGVELAEGFYHSFAGWLVFVVALAVLVGANWVLQRLSRGREEQSSPQTPEPVGSPPERGAPP